MRLKYCVERPIIHLSTKTNHSKLELRISDQGMGIPTESLEYIFEKFYRVPTGDIHDVKGFGLGLTYVKNIVDAHGFEIQVKSKIGKETTFIISMDIDSMKEEELCR